MRSINLLLIDDNEDEFVLIKDELSRIPGAKFNVDWCGSSRLAGQEILKNSHDVYLIDYHLDEKSGLQIIEEARRSGFEGPCIVLSIQGDYRLDLMAMRTGAQDYLDKAYLNPASLERAIFMSIERNALMRERDALNTRMRETQRLESLGLMAGGLAHDFNNLLGCILGNIEMAKLQKDNENAFEQCMDRALIAVDQASALSNQMLAYSGRGKFKINTLDMSQVCKQSMSVLASSIPAKIKVVTEMENSIFIDADATQFQQVFMNLVTNARDSIPDAGKIHIRTGVAKNVSTTFFRKAFLKPEARGKKDFAWLEVRDSGIGMDQKTLERIFDPFFSTKTKGRGLGLAAVLGIIKGHHGAVEIESALGKGTSFLIYFPISEKALSSKKQELCAMPLKGSKASSSRPLLLVVDDNASLLEVASTMLTFAGYNPICANGGYQALELFERHQKDVQGVILDMTMPDMDGEEVYERLIQMRPDLNVILSSGYHESELMGKFAGSGKVGFIQKPYKPTQLINAVKKSLVIAD